MTEMQQMHLFSEFADAIHPHIRQVYTLGKCQAPNFWRIRYERLNCRIRQPDAARQIHRPEMYELRCHRYLFPQFREHRETILGETYVSRPSKFTK